MYDVVVVGQGLSGLLAAIWGREQGQRVALVSSGTGKILQSTGVLDVIPGHGGKFTDLAQKYQLDSLSKLSVMDAVKEFKQLTMRLGYPYQGDTETPVQIVTGSGHVKWTALYPKTIKPIPEMGRVVIVGFQEIVDFQPKYIKGNLQKERPLLTIDTITISLGQNSLRTMTQLDAARLLDQEEICTHLIKNIKKGMEEKRIAKPDIFIFPASLGVENWNQVLKRLCSGLNASVTEAPGMPPNASAIRLHEALEKKAIKLGVRFYADTTVLGCVIEQNIVQVLKIKNSSRSTELVGDTYVIAAGGVLGGGLEATAEGLKDKVLGLEVDESGGYLHCPRNVYPLGASQGTKVTHYGITGGVYSILSSYEVLSIIRESSLGGLQHA